MKFQSKTVVLGLAIMLMGLVSGLASNASALTANGNPYSTPAKMDGAICPTNGKLACMKYAMEIRHDLVTDKYYAWGQIYQGDDQQTKVQVRGIQLDKINLGITSGVLTYSTPVHSDASKPWEVGTLTPEVHTTLQKQLAEHMYFTVRYNDSAVGSLVSYQSNILKVTP